MKQKKGNVSLKSSLNGSKNVSMVKSPKTPAKGTPVKPTPKKKAKTPIKVVPPKEVEAEEEDGSEEEDSGADVAACISGEAEVSDEDGEDDGDEEGEDEDDEEVNEGDEESENGEQDAEEDDDESDEQPEEAPVVKKVLELVPKQKKNKNQDANDETGVPGIKTGALPKTFPKNQVLIVKNLPTSCKQIDLVEIFGKFGTLHTIYNNRGPAGTTAFVAYSSPEEAEAAQIATDKIAKVKGSTIIVNLQLSTKKVKSAEERKKSAEDKKASYLEKKRLREESKDRTVYVKSIKRSTTNDQLREHFAECGDIEDLRKMSRNSTSYAFITFTDKSSIPAALSRHNTILDGMNIFVVKSETRDIARDPERTILVKNKQNLECVEIEKMESIFTKFGEIEDLCILCSKNVLAFVTYKDPKSAKKALKLNGTISEDLELEVEEYKVITPKCRSTIFIKNLHSNVTKEEIQEHFASCGQIESVVLHQNGYGIVKFQDIEGFCKSFAMNETFLHGNCIFLEPYSEKKQIMLKKNHPNSFNNRKRPSGGPFHKSGNGKKRKMF